MNNNKISNFVIIILLVIILITVLQKKSNKKKSNNKKVIEDFGTLGANLDNAVVPAFTNNNSGWVIQKTSTCPGNYERKRNHYCTPGSLTLNSNIGEYQNGNVQNAKKKCDDRHDCVGFNYKDGTYILKQKINKDNQSGQIKGAYNTNFTCFAKSNHLHPYQLN